ncbi:cation transporter [Zhouia sp. PK063]|uniref:cation transporter n=1 Tax=Zhouia sp. PK063 TaxID=3373602 RepID=UPI0037A41CF1
MKKVILVMALAATVMVGCKTNEKKEEKTVTETSVSESAGEMAMVETTFGVRGNCEMCKKTIEKAALGVPGVSSADWNVDEKKIDVKFDEAQTNENAIKTAIAEAGYDTDGIASNENAYKDLPKCCQYDHDMEMNQEGKPVENNELHKE